MWFLVVLDIDINLFIWLLKDYVPCETAWNILAAYVHSKQLSINELCSWLATRTKCSREGPMVESEILVDTLQRLSLNGVNENETSISHDGEWILPEDD